MLHATGWSFVGMHLFWWLFWVALIGMAFTTITPVPKSQFRSGGRALDILRRGDAAGKVTTDEYERRKTVLERDDPITPSAARTHWHPCTDLIHGRRGETS